MNVEHHLGDVHHMHVPHGNLLLDLIRDRHTTLLPRRVLVDGITVREIPHMVKIVFHHADFLEVRIVLVDIVDLAVRHRLLHAQDNLVIGQIVLSVHHLIEVQETLHPMGVTN